MSNKTPGMSCKRKAVEKHGKTSSPYGRELTKKAYREIVEPIHWKEVLVRLQEKIQRQILD
jgi:hypothetical protein